MDSNKGLSKGKKIIVISLLSIFVILLGIAAILLSIQKDPTRTIMIYMSGNNLETDGYSATAELKGIDPSKIDLEKYHILLYTGGTKKWHNFVDSNENAIYELKETGFEKVKTYNKNNMGSADTLAEFLTYGYNNYPAGNYDLFLWDHGAGSLGSISDEFTGDLISLNEFTTALENSPFNSKNKLETVIFETCLNGSLEMATIMSEYANYLVASEEVTMGDNVESELVFLNNLEEIENSYQLGVAFVDGYFKKLEKMNYLFDITSEYGVIDLNQIPELNKKMSNLYSEIDLNKDYNDIARVRANTYQFAVNTANSYDYDTVDLYEFVDGLKTIDKKKSQDIKDFIKNKVILYHVAKTEHANGISTYIPYNSRSIIINKHFSSFKNTNLSDNYINFISKFNKMKNSSSSSYSFDLSSNETKGNNKEFKLKLTEEQIKNYSRAKYIIFEKTDNNMFMPLYDASDVKLDKDGYLSTNISNNLISLVDDTDGSRAFFNISQVGSDDQGNIDYSAQVILNKTDEEGWPVIDHGVMHLKKDKDNNVNVEKIYLVKNDEETELVSTGLAIDLAGYTSIDFSNLRYNILDANGNYTPNWESTGTLYFIESRITDVYHFEATSIEDGDYYCVFVVYDVQNKPNYSNLIKIN